MKANNTYNVVIANEAYNFTPTKYNTILTGFASVEDANNAAYEALRDIQGEIGYNKTEKRYNETLGVWVLYNPNTGAWLITAKIEEVTETDNTTPETSDTMNTETNAVTVTISSDDSNLYTATVNGVEVGSVNTWVNNTFAAAYNFGISTRKRLAMPELDNANDAAHGFMTEANAVLWLGDMIARYFSEHGINAKIVNA